MLVQGSLREIDIPNSAVTDAGVEMIQRGCRPRSLKLTGSRVTDDCLRSLSLIPELGSLDLSHTAITDAGLKLAKLAPGRPVNSQDTIYLDLSGTGVTREGIMEFLHQNSDYRLRVRFGPSEFIELPRDPRSVPPTF